MDMQEPEEQRLEEEPMEPAEDVGTLSDEPVLSDTDASKSVEEPASVPPSEDETVELSVTAEPEEESIPEALMNKDADEEPTEEEPDEEIIPDTSSENMVETVSAEIEPDEMPVAEASTDEDIEVDSAEEMSKPEQDDDPSDWFVVHCYSGYENKVRHNLEQRIETMGMKDMIFDVVVPTQEEIEVRDGKRRTVERHIFPGYVLVNMILTEESWYVVRNTPGVTGFVGMGNNPTPLRPEEVAQIVKRMEADAPTVKVTFKVGERVRIIDGPFNDFRGVVSEIDMERTKVRVMVSFFGRETPVELDFLQVEKA